MCIMYVWVYGTRTQRPEVPAARRVDVTRRRRRRRSAQT